MLFTGKTRVFNRPPEIIPNSQCAAPKVLVQLPIANDTPEPIRLLLTETRVNANGKVVWTDRTEHFQQNIRSYNNAVSFTSLGVKLDRAICNTLNAAGVYTFRIQGALHRSMGSLLPPPGERPRFAQVYMFDSAQEQLDLRSETHPNLRLDIVQLLGGSFKRSIRMSNFGKTRPNGSQRSKGSRSTSLQ